MEHLYNITPFQGSEDITKDVTNGLLETEIGEGQSKSMSSGQVFCVVVVACSRSNHLTF